MKRRDFIRRLVAVPLVGSLLKSMAAFAGWNVEAFSAVTEKKAMEIFYPGRDVIESDRIRIGVHDLIENGAVVPIKIESDLPSVTSVSILVERNPNPLIAHFELGAGCRAFVATRIKMGAPSDIIAIVQSEEKLYSTRKFVEVVEGGCG